MTRQYATVAVKPNSAGFEPDFFEIRRVVNLAALQLRLELHYMLSEAHFEP